MEMTIEDARYCLENGGFCSASCKYFSDRDPNCEDNVRKIAVETMCKYQKIEKIAEKANLKLLPKEGMSTFQKEILGVLEDGKND